MFSSPFPHVISSASIDVVTVLASCKTTLDTLRELNEHYGRWRGRYGVGNRIKLAYTRKIIDAIHSGELLAANYKKTEVFGLEIPSAIDGVPSEILDPINTVSSIIIISS